MDSPSSPLSTLARNASSRRAPGLNVNSTPPRTASPAQPTSPLLHSQFRSSVATDVGDYYNRPPYDEPGIVHNFSRNAPAVVVTAPDDYDSNSLSGTTHPDPHPRPNFSRPVLKSSLSTSTPPASPYLQSPQPSPADDYLQLGIKHHEANRLDQSAVCFEKSAREGSGVGMLMWGLTLRHGWGCPKNEKSGFHWLQKAAEGAVVDLESGRKGGVDVTAVQGELVIAIFEVGQCFFQGWGTKKDKVMAVSYFQVAARLGDADAQQSLAFCLANGKGCKKDKKEAAKWYRNAVAQGGVSDVGLAWIFKDKYR